MKNRMPNMIGERFPIVAYVDLITFNKIENLRGDISRSRFIGKIIQKSLNSIKERIGNIDMKNTNIEENNENTILVTSVPEKSWRTTEPRATPANLKKVNAIER